MKSLVAVLAGVAALSATAASAAAPQVVVKLAAPVAAASKIIAGGAVFQCEADACVSRSVVSDSLTRTCRDVVREAGSAAAVTAGDRALTEAQLTACNTSAKK